MKNPFLEQYKKEKLRECQLKQLDILKELDKLCKKHGIEYWIDGGTLLGAVRHGGFIPWDDDIDVGMTVDNYNKFKAIVKELPGHLFFQNNETDGKQCAIPKIRDLNSLYIEPLYDFDEPYQKGVYIDIFPKAFYPNASKKLLSKLNKCISKSYAILHAKHYYSSKSFVEFFYFGIQWLVNMGIWKFLNRLCKKNRYLDNVPPLNGPGYIHTKEAVFPLSEIVFEGYKFSAPAYPDLYLKEQYDNYMVIPPKERQIIHGIFYQPQLIADERSSC
ncbi:MAG: LicD family protein [Muribaculaceae bacterium]|nr:LicD family protein [Muribaculaceae bacterium]